MECGGEKLWWTQLGECVGRILLRTVVEELNRGMWWRIWIQENGGGVRWMTGLHDYGGGERWRSVMVAKDDKNRCLTEQTQILKHLHEPYKNTLLQSRVSPVSISFTHVTSLAF